MRKSVKILSINSQNLQDTSSIPPVAVILKKMISEAKEAGDYSKLLEYIESILNSGVTLNHHVFTSIIRAYGDAGMLGQAIAMLRVMKDFGIMPNVYHYGAIMQSCRKASQWEMALELFNRMIKSNVPRNAVIYNILITTLGESKQFELAMDLFERMSSTDQIPRDLISYSAAISAAATCGRWEKSFELYEKMGNEKLNPNTIVLNTVLSACNNGRQYLRCLQLFDEAVPNNIYRDMISYAQAIIACGEIGDLERAFRLFDEMSPINRGWWLRTTYDSLMNNVTITNDTMTFQSYRNEYFKTFSQTRFTLKRDTGTYNALITSCAKSKRWEEALLLLKSMSEEGVRPDARTYAAAITACSSVGRWKEALLLFQEMPSQGVPCPSLHYTCNVIHRLYLSLNCSI